MTPVPFNEPRPIPLSAYERALDRFVHRVSQVPGVLAIYQIGSISCPGISDIDLIVVVDPSQGPFRTKTSVQMEDEEEAFLFFHQPIHVDTALMSQIYHLFYVSDLRRVWGEAVEIVEPTQDEEQVLNAIKLIEVLIFDMPRSLAVLLGAPAYDVRAGLLRINALCHTLHLWSDGGKQLRKEWQEYADAAMRLRRVWFELGVERHGQLWNLLKQGHKVSLALAVQVAQCIREAWHLTTANDSAYALYSDRFYPTLFAPLRFHQDRAQAVRGDRWGRVFTTLPLELGVLLKSYGEGNGPISRHVWHHFWDCASYNLAPYPADVMTRRAKLINDQTELIMAAHLQGTLFFWNGLGYRYRFSWIEKAKGYARVPLTWLEDTVIRHRLGRLHRQLRRNNPRNRCF
jgi:hypothetical protein